MGQEEALASDSALARFRGINWVNALRLRLDYLDYVWTKWVLNYQDKQTSLLGRILGKVEPWRIAVFFIASGALALVPVFLMTWLGRRTARRDPVDHLYEVFCGRLKRAGLARHKGEGPRAFAHRVCRRYPSLAEEVAEITRVYEQVRYREDEMGLDELRGLVRGFRPHWKVKK